MREADFQLRNAGLGRSPGVFLSCVRRGQLRIGEQVAPPLWIEQPQCFAPDHEVKPDRVAPKAWLAVCQPDRGQAFVATLAQNETLQPASQAISRRVKQEVFTDAERCVDALLAALVFASRAVGRDLQNEVGDLGLIP